MLMKLSRLGSALAAAFALCGAARAQNWEATDFAARTDGKLHLLWRHQSGGVPDGQVSLWTLDNDAGYLSAVTVGPYAGWDVLEMLVNRADNTPHLVWVQPNGLTFDNETVSVWNFDSNTAFQSARTFGPFSGWNANQADINPLTGQQFLSWAGPTLELSLWRLDSSSQFQEAYTYGSFTDWDADLLAFSPVDGKLRQLWAHLGLDGLLDGQYSLWRLGNTGAFEAATTLNAPGWLLDNTSIGSDNKVRLLWVDNNNQDVSLWRLSASDQFEGAISFSPPADWAVWTLVPRPDGNQLLIWQNTVTYDLSIWLLDSTEHFISAVTIIAPDGWYVWSFDVDGANKLHLLWVNEGDGSASIWRLGTTLSFEHAASFGPY